MLAAHPSTRERARETGRGEGGDESVFIDRAAEEVIFGELESLHAQGHRFSALSEERGHVNYGAPLPLVVIDPIDGSLNAKRGLAPHSLSVAVADGLTMADVFFAFVHDFGAREQWTAQRDGSTQLNGKPLLAAPSERRMTDGRLELVAIESSNPRLIEAAAPALVRCAHRVRALGSMAVSMCQVSAVRVDGMVSLWRCRSVDVAAAQLVVRQSGGLVAFTEFTDPLGAPLDLIAHSPVVAARSPLALQQLSGVSPSVS